jgi:hypothetical protein
MPLALAVAVAILALFPPSSAVASEPGSISGTVTDAKTSAPIAAIEVCAYPPGFEGIGPETVSCKATDAKGEYTLTGLLSGQYIVEFSPPAGSQLNYISQYYNERSSEANASRVTVTAATTTTGINARLREGGIIAGTVSQAGTGAAIGGITVCAQGNGGGNEGFECAVTESNGKYSITRLGSGSYTVVFSPPLGTTRPNYVTQYYSGQLSRLGATPVSVTAEATTPAIDAALQVGGQLSGTVIDAATGAALHGALVCAISLSPEFVECVTTDELGHYLISGLPSADYVVRFSAKGYLTQYYSSRYKRAEALTVPLFAGESKTGIDASMSTAPATLPVDTAAPTVSGTATVGDLLSCSPGTWAAKPPPTLAYQWLRDGVAIAGAGEAAYTASKADVGHALSCQVTATNAVGAKSATSAAVTIAPDALELPFVQLLSRRLVLKGRSIGVKLRCEHVRCNGTIGLVARLRKGKRRVEVTLARGRFSLAAGRKQTVPLRLLGRRARAALAAVRKHPVAVRLELSVQGGNQVDESARVS